jgi:group I intron endonuclease
MWLFKKLNGHSKTDFFILIYKYKKVGFMKSGIYKIINIVNNKFYIGSSKELSKRWTQHKSKLKYNKHGNIILQRSWNKYGKECFIFEIIEECDVAFLLEREQFFLDTLKPYYNIGLKSSGGDNLTNHPNRDEIIQKMSDGVRERYLNWSDDERKTYSEKYNGDKNPNFGKNWTDGMKEVARLRSTEYFKIHDVFNKGKKIDEIYGEEKAEEIRKKISIFASTRIGEKNPFFGKSHSEEYKKNASEKRKGKYYGEQNISFLIDDKEYESLGIASKELNIPITTIRWRLKSKNEKFINYQYKN